MSLSYKSGTIPPVAIADATDAMRQDFACEVCGCRYGLGYPVLRRGEWQRNWVRLQCSTRKDPMTWRKSFVNPVVGRAEAPDIFRRMRDEADSIAKFAVKF